MAPCFFSTATTTLSITAGWSNLHRTPHVESWPCTHRQEVTHTADRKPDHTCPQFFWIYLISDVFLDADWHAVQKPFLVSVDVFKLLHGTHQHLSVAVQFAVHLQSLWSTTLAGLWWFHFSITKVQQKTFFTIIAVNNDIIASGVHEYKPRVNMYSIYFWMKLFSLQTLQIWQLDYFLCFNLLQRIILLYFIFQFLHCGNL